MTENMFDYLFNLEKFGIKMGLDSTLKILEKLNNPQNNFKSIHIAGTNGKGSTSNFLAGCIQANNLKVGLYTSPHLKKFNERIKINNIDISDKELISLTKEIKLISEENNINLTFFEFTTILAFLYFSRNKVDYAIIEVGLGGRLDATNVINPIASIITNIHFDHMHILGNTLLEIAKEKAGIIKNNIPLITAEKNKEVLNLFKETCNKKNSQLIEISDYKIIELNLNNQKFIYKNKEYTIKMLGEHQISNACLAIEILNLLNLQVQNLENIFWKGRLQIISTNPLIIVDGAHNIDGINKLTEFVSKLNKKIILILALSKEKNVNELTEKILNYCSHVIITQGTFKPMDKEELFDKLNFSSKEIIENPCIALEKAKQICKDEIILVTGSLYMIHEVLN